MLDLSSISELYPFQPKFHRIKDYNYAYIDEGSGNPVVMIHGNPTWSFFYRNLISEFSKSHRVIAPDHLGCGSSDKPQDYDYRLEAHIDNLESLLIKLDLKKITLVMHDWGGAIGMGFAVRQPKRVKALVILNSAAYSVSFIPWRIALCRIPWLGKFMVQQLNLFCKFALFMAVEKPLSKEVKQGYLLPYQTSMDRIGVSKFVEDIPRGPECRSYEMLLEVEHGLWMFRELPIALIWGMKDWCFNQRFLRRWKVYYPEAEVFKLEKAGHYLIEDSPDQVISSLQNFFNHHQL